ncbi:hypothetical protein K431DRAFT_346704 [Polychaeton citri CBS 116435]|uniref:CDP-diacylglycerol--serine O-phosphatidyltransferase n=1 Tax=Polychaeton citri CBS 116435 TaxID=1314669 RepID=A0A9P4UQ08_9PEZI|nr:hypothetical protein K431DRAFT_346704 [Polychaeton citri CBS 116435]
MVVIKEVRFDMIRRLRVADYVTLSNANKWDVASCGVFSIFCSMQHDYIRAHLLLFVAYECDRFDGIVARWMNQCSDWGKQLDSFSDLVSFIMGPAIMLHTIGFQTLVDQVVLIFWVLCGLTRLVRFNVVAHLVPRDAHGKALYHEGLASPYAALIVSTAVAVSTWMEWTSEIVLSSVIFSGTWPEFHLALVPVLVMSVMMLLEQITNSSV